MKNKEIEELLNDMRHSYEIHEEIIKKYNNADKISYPYTINLKQIDLLLSYIEQLEKKVDQYENPDDLTLFYMWLDTKAKDKMKQLEKRNKELYEGFMATQEELTDYATKNEQLENNRDKAIEIINIEKSKMEYAKYDSCLLLIEQVLKGDSDDILKGDSK